MAQYKVLQDIEAEDKLLGPLSLRQFLYAVIVVVLGFVGFKLATVKWFLALPFVPPMVFFGLLAAPFGRDQPSEVWMLAKIRFWVKTRKRIWDQTGVRELVTITVPKTIEKILTKGFSHEEVTSRLKALSATMDTRGWAVKNIDTATYRQPLLTNNTSSDRLVDISSVPQDDDVSVDPESDILDENSNPVAHHVDQTLDQSSQAHRQQLLERVHKLAQAQKQPLATPQQPAPAGPQSVQVQAPTASNPTPADQAAMQAVQQQVQASNLSTANMRTIQPTAPQNAPPQSAPQQPAPAGSQPMPQTAVTPIRDPDILKLVKSNDLNVATIAREANKDKDSEPPQDEVVISLR